MLYKNVVIVGGFLGNTNSSGHLFTKAAAGISFWYSGLYGSTGACANYVGSRYNYIDFHQYSNDASTVKPYVYNSSSLNHDTYHTTRCGITALLLRRHESSYSFVGSRFIIIECSLCLLWEISLVLFKVEGDGVFVVTPRLYLSSDSWCKTW